MFPPNLDSVQDFIKLMINQCTELQLDRWKWDQSKLAAMVDHLKGYEGYHGGLGKIP